MYNNFQWDDSILGEASDKNILKECQRQVEELLYRKSKMFRHPYALTLDIYASSLSSLVALNAIALSGGVYSCNKMHVAQITAGLNQIVDNFPEGSYMDVVPLMLSEAPINVQAKL